MIRTNRTKKRKINRELHDIQTIYSARDTNVESNVTDFANEVLPSTNGLILPSRSNTFCQNNTTKTTYITSSINSEVETQEGEVVIQDEDEVVIQQQIEVVQRIETISTFKDDLTAWAIECKVCQSTVNKLLKIMKKRKTINTDNLPSDCRTLLQTPITLSANIRNVDPGSYYHFGLAAGIKRYDTSNLNDIKIAIGIDGLPLAKSSNSQFWPILAFIVDEAKDVFPIGVYHGNAKPIDSNDFLADFITELKDLLVNGINIDGSNKKVSIHVFVCDAPAKSFVLKIKGHSGFYSCTRCTQEGEYFKNRVCFPYSKDKSDERTHEAYLNMLNEEHHVGNTLSQLVELPGLDLIQTFSLDYMHLVCLGAVRKLILLWLNKGPLKVRLSNCNVQKLSKSLLEIKSFIPSDFARKTRELQDIGRWKATELRLFLLYIGPIVLRNMTNKDVLTNFMCLHVSMLILLSPNRACHLEYAKELLDYFVNTFQIIYGQEHISHNIHGLLHLTDDYRYYGPLDNSSAFAFENYMKELKSNVRKYDKPLEQLINRYTELYNQPRTHLVKNQKQHKMLSRPHRNGPLINDIKGIQYCQLNVGKIKINVSVDKESYILTKNEEVVKCLNIVHIQNNIVLIGKTFEYKTMLYEKPMDSTIFDIFTVKKLSHDLKTWDISEIKKKVMLIYDGISSIAMPIIHT